MHIPALSELSLISEKYCNFEARIIFNYNVSLIVYLCKSNN